MVITVVACSNVKSENSTNMEEHKFKAGKNQVSFKSNGNLLMGHLYLPADYEHGKEYPAIVVGGSWTTVKEQMAGLYAQKLSENGFVALAFDHTNYGESEGIKRFFEDPKVKSVDFVNAMSYLNSLPMVSSSKTGGMGVCASGGYMAEAVGQTDQFKSFAAVVPWFNTDEVVNAFYGGESGIKERIEKSRAAVNKFQETGEMEYQLTISDSDPTAAMYGPFEYYLNPNIGQVANWSHDKFAVMSWEPWLTYRPVGAAKSIDIPTLIITSEGAATPKADQEFFELLQGEKELVWLEGGQLDFYYKDEQVNASVEKLVEHFRRTL
mgnify:CR=1 FL=1